MPKGLAFGGGLDMDSSLRKSKSSPFPQLPLLPTLITVPLAVAKRGQRHTIQLFPIRQENTGRPTWEQLWERQAGAKLSRLSRLLISWRRAFSIKRGRVCLTPGIVLRRR